MYRNLSHQPLVPAVVIIKAQIPAFLLYIKTKRGITTLSQITHGNARICGEEMFKISEELCPHFIQSQVTLLPKSI